jgi:hypothetical protein
MPVSSTHPRLKRILNLSSLPVDISANIQNGIENLYDDLYYTNHIFNKSYYGDIVNHSLTLVSYKKLGISIPGCDDMALLLNPNLTEDGITNSQFDIEFEFNYPLLRFSRSISAEGFTGNPKELLDLILSFFNITIEDILIEILEMFFPGTNSLSDFVNDFNTKNPLTTLTLSNTYGVNKIADLLNQISNYNLDVLDALFENYLSQIELKETFNAILKICGKWLRSFSKQDLLDFLIPDFSLSLNKYIRLCSYKTRKPISISTKIIDLHTNLSLISNISILISNSPTHPTIFLHSSPPLPHFRYRLVFLFSFSYTS